MGAWWQAWLEGDGLGASTEALTEKQKEVEGTVSPIMQRAYEGVSGRRCSSLGHP